LLGFSSTIKLTPEICCCAGIGMSPKIIIVFYVLLELMRIGCICSLIVISAREYGTIFKLIGVKLKIFRL
jgi:hypothetical protein